MRETKTLNKLFRVIFAFSAILLINLFSSNAAADSMPVSTKGVVVVEASGLMDPVMFEMMMETLEKVDPSETIALVFQVNVSGSVIGTEEIIELGQVITSSKIPISFWVGPSGARAKGPIAELALLSGDVGISPGSKIGKIGSNIFSSSSNAEKTVLDLSEKTFNYKEAVDSGIARSSPVLLEHLVGLEGFEVISDIETGETKPLRPV